MLEMSHIEDREASMRTRDNPHTHTDTDTYTDPPSPKSLSDIENITPLKSTSRGSKEISGIWKGLCVNRTSRVVVSRALVLISLLLTAALCGTVSYIYLSRLEMNRYQDELDSISFRIVASSNDFLQTITHQTEELSSVYSVFYPNPESWPNTSISGVQTIYEDILNSGIPFVGHCPIVRPDQLAVFEAYALEVFGNVNDFPPGCGQYGVFSTDINGSIYHDTTAETSFSEHNILTPILNAGFQGYDIYAPWLMLYNVHSHIDRGTAMDNVLACTQSNSYKKCSTLSGVFNRNPSTAVISPTVANYDPSETVVGYSIATFEWVDVFSGILPDYIEGIDCVLKAGEFQYTFSFKDGEAVFKGAGDMHDEEYSSERHSSTLSLNSSTELYVPYQLDIYPRDSFYSIYNTDVPLIMCVSGVSVILFTSAIFFLYDYFVEANSAAQENILSAKRRYVRFISHEVRTPMNTVCMGLKLLENGITKCSDENNELIQDLVEITHDLQASAESAVTVLNDLLNYDKIESGTLKLEFSNIDLWELVRTSVRALSVHATQKFIQLNVFCEDKVPVSGLMGNSSHQCGKNLHELYCHGDICRLAQVLRNLLSNAIKFSPSNSVIDISVTWNPQGLKGTKPLGPLPVDKNDSSLVSDVTITPAGSILVSVRDNGPGISKENMKYLFQEGVQFNANELQNGQGSGLGLCISKYIVHLHGGQIWAESEGEGCGTVFYMEIPVVRIVGYTRTNSSAGLEGPMVRHTTTVESSDCISSVEAKPRVLIVDDASTNRKLLTRILKLHGYESDVLCDGEECVEMYESANDVTTYGCILMDYQMPRLNGPEATKRLREMKIDVKIIGLTGNVMSDDVSYFLRCGADGVLFKPFDIKKFENIIREPLLR
mmetsp:Transcript_331/g.616  ORF Transcript_331/g.616 Transcript_331/m.616 type:complete len:888 (+) Transcript_331:132-2795(+)|eukprot:CAMPEP_0185032892 /NCGR_PEP_ID=MMETSP1103-20130426/21406_1 /TAXON_ID=36769 /ORGANISM="Paraphysomonas bandaiensis, Strain Caron Lab Isolate" /LENGTH=887 /DNA_ID=CAMNT_0027568967 /DNA_START=59 /DNA_END=2722 /DNA_ORIENTATION=-